MGGGAPQVQTPKLPDPGQEYSSALSAYTKGAPALYQEESQYQPLYNQMNQQMALQNANAYMAYYDARAPQEQQLSDALQAQATGEALGRYQTYGQAASQAALAANPFTGQMQALANRQLNAAPDATMQGILANAQGALPGQITGLQNLSQQVGMDVTGTNQALQGLYGQVGTQTQAGADYLTQLRNQVGANQRSDIFNQTAGNIMGALGQVDPLTQQLKTQASQQLALGSSLSPSEIADATQAARAAFSARGMMQSNPSMAAEVLNRYNVGQQRLQQRQQFASGVSQIADTQAQERVANAFGLTQADIGATQANQTLAGQLAQGVTGLQQSGIQLQSGLQGQIAANLANARSQQAALQSQAISAYQSGLQQQAGLQGSILDEQFRQQQAGTQGLQYLSGIGQGGLASILGVQQGAPQYMQYSTAGLGQNTGGPDLFQSSGVLQMVAQNEAMKFNAQMSANQMNAQSKGAASGAMIGAGAGIAGALITGVAAL